MLLTGIGIFIIQKKLDDYKKLNDNKKKQKKLKAELKTAWNKINDMEAKIKRSN